jgi:hypothetical protein
MAARRAWKATMALPAWVTLEAEAAGILGAAAVMAGEGDKAMKFTVIAGSLLLAAPWLVSAQAPEVFPSPEAAAKALVGAAQQNNTAQLATIFGQDGPRILSSGNPSQDRAEREQFVQLALTKFQLDPDPNNPGRVYLSIGADNWPFPAPIVRTKAGWVFDPSQAVVEMQARKVGADELDAIEICSGFVSAQRQYATQPRDAHQMQEYAPQIMSSPGQHDGLYWEGTETGAGQPLVPRGFAEADVSRANSNAKPYHGYYFRVLNSQGPDAPGGPHQYVVKGIMFGGFALEAWPAQYGVTGVHTFIVNQTGIVYEKDLGPQTGTLALAMKTYNPDDSWTDVN